MNPGLRGDPEAHPSLALRSVSRLNRGPGRRRQASRAPGEFAPGRGRRRVRAGRSAAGERSPGGKAAAIAAASLRASPCEGAGRRFSSLQLCEAQRPKGEGVPRTIRRPGDVSQRRAQSRAPGQPWAGPGSARSRDGRTGREQGRPETPALRAAQPAAGKAWRMGPRRSGIRRNREKHSRQWVQGKR